MMSTLRTIRMRTHVPRGTTSERTWSTEHLIRRACLAKALLVTITASAQLVHAAGEGQTKFKRISTQFIAALGDPGASSGRGAQLWGLWPLDPGPRSVKLNRYQSLKNSSGVAPARWKFDQTDRVAGGTRLDHGATDHSTPSRKISGHGRSQGDGRADHSSRRQP